MKFTGIMFLFLIALLATMGCTPKDDQPQPVPPQPQPVQTVIYLIRHAEKADNSADPNLSPWFAKSRELGGHFADVTFAAFYSTNYNRTLQTICNK